MDDNRTELEQLRQQVAKLEKLSAQLEQTQAALKENEARYRALFEGSPISLWEEDFSQVKERVDGLRIAGITDIRDYFEQNPDAVKRAAELIKIVDVNRQTLRMFKAATKTELLENLAKVLGPASYEVFREELVTLAEGNSSFESEIINYALDDEAIYVSIRLAIAPGYEDTWSKVFVSLVDITRRKLAEQDRERAYAELEQRVEERTAELSKANNRYQRVHEFFMSTFEQLESVAQHGVTGPEVLQYVNEARQQFDKITANGNNKAAGDTED